MTSTKTRAAPENFYDDAAYDLLPAEEFEPVPSESLHMESFTVDVICTKCGTWKSEHDWDSCAHPNFI